MDDAEKLRKFLPDYIDLENGDLQVPAGNRETFEVANRIENAQVLRVREIASVVGSNATEPLSSYFVNPTTRAEERTVLQGSELTTAEKNTQLTHDQLVASSSVIANEELDKELDETTAAKQTKLPADDDAEGEDVEDVKNAENDEGSGNGDLVVKLPKPKTIKGTVKARPKTEGKDAVKDSTKDIPKEGDVKETSKENAKETLIPMFAHPGRAQGFCHGVLTTLR
ncbi:hypothetical protein HDV00_009907 [Rhizophlyctis rosea]|nr:hypothetical protein HDV00_009907 [Rhizophlyctis rosea]